VYEIMDKKGLKGAIIFLAREFGGVHLGKDRFVIINQVVQQAMSKMNAAVTRNPKLLKPERLQVNYEEENMLQGMAPVREPKPKSATNLAEQAANRLAVLRQGQQANTLEAQEENVPQDFEEEGNTKDNIGVEKDMTKHKSTYNGPPIEAEGATAWHLPKQGQAAPDSMKLDFPSLLLPPRPQLVRDDLRQAPPPPRPQAGVDKESPVVLNTLADKESLNLPTSRKENQLQKLAIREHDTTESKRARRKNRQARRKANFVSNINLANLVISSPKVSTIKADGQIKPKPSPKRARESESDVNKE
jgi:hypothetical protein